MALALPHRVRRVPVAMVSVDVCLHPLLLDRGLLTFAIGFATFFMMPPSPTQTRNWFRPNGWFTEREETIIVSRVLRDDPTKASDLLSHYDVRDLPWSVGGYA